MNIIRQSCDALRSECYFITDDMTQQDLQRKRDLKPVIEQVQRENIRWRYRNGKLIIDGQQRQGQHPVK